MTERNRNRGKQAERGGGLAMRIRSIVATTIVLALVVPTASAGKKGLDLQAPCLGHEGSPVQSAGRGWTKISTPDFPDPLLPHSGSLGPQPSDLDVISDFAIDPANPKRMFATNNQVVVRSEDGGCTWKIVLETARARDSRTTPQVAIEVPSSGAGTIHVLIDNFNGLGGNGLTFQTSHDWGNSWTTSADFQNESAGMSPCSTVGYWFRIAPTDSKTLYACLTPSALRLGTHPWLFYKSTDGGQTWSPQGDMLNGALAIAPRFSPIENSDLAFEVDPLEAESLIARWTSSGGANPATRHVSVSTNGGGEWSDLRVDDHTNENSPLSIQHPAGADRAIYVGSSQDATNETCGGGPGQGCVLMSPDNGSSWSPMYIPVPQQVWALRAGEKSNQLLVSTREEGKVFRFEPRIAAWLDITPKLESLPYVQNILVDRLSKQGFYFVRSDAVFVYRGKV